jgi:hypothetical protein
MPKAIHPYTGDFLRKCRVCGLEAHTVPELEMFVRDHKYRWSRKNECKDCQFRRIRGQEPIRDIRSLVPQVPEPGGVKL